MGRRERAGRCRGVKFARLSVHHVVKDRPPAPCRVSIDASDFRSFRQLPPGTNALMPAVRHSGTASAAQ